MCDQPLQALAKSQIAKIQIALRRPVPPPVISLGKKWIIPRDTVMTRLFGAILCELRRAG
jgi:hypothetical protein